MKSDNLISGLEGAQQLPSGKGHLYEEIGNCIGTLQRAPQQKHRAPGQLLWCRGSFKACM